MNSPLISKAEAIQLHVEGKTRQAETAYRQMIANGFRDRDIFNNLGVVCLETARHQEAETLFRAALQLDKDFAEAYSGLGSALTAIAPDKAEAMFKKAVHLKPDFHQAHYNLANLYWKLGRLEEAISRYRKVLDLQPGFVSARFNMSMAILLTGNLKEGFAEYECRLERPKYRSIIGLPWSKRRWNGDFGTRDRVVLIPEPGYGDIFHFMRYGKLLRQRGIHVVLQAQASLKTLLDSSDCYDEFAPFGADFDDTTHCWCPMFSLPYYFGTTLDDIPADIPYLRSDPERMARWRERLPKGKKLVGINWQGNPHHEKTMNEGRSAPLEAFRALAETEGIQLVSLQKSYGLEQLQQSTFRDKILVFDEREYPSEPAFLEAAALISALDLVVTSDTSIAHLAGALGAPVWVALSHLPEWRWLKARDDTPWYPTMKLYRQPDPGDWASVFDEIVAALR